MCRFFLADYEVFWFGHFLTPFSAANGEWKSPNLGRSPMCLHAPGLCILNLFHSSEGRKARNARKKSPQRTDMKMMIDPFRSRAHFSGHLNQWIFQPQGLTLSLVTPWLYPSTSKKRYYVICIYMLDICYIDMYMNITRMYAHITPSQQQIRHWRPALVKRKWRS